MIKNTALECVISAVDCLRQRMEFLGLSKLSCDFLEEPFLYLISEISCLTMGKGKSDNGSRAISMHEYNRILGCLEQLSTMLWERHQECKDQVHTKENADLFHGMSYAYLDAHYNVMDVIKTACELKNRG